MKKGVKGHQKKGYNGKVCLLYTAVNIVIFYIQQIENGNIYIYIYFFLNKGIDQISVPNFKKKDPKG